MARGRGNALAEYLVQIGWDMDMTEMNSVQQVVTKTFNKFDSLIATLKKSWVGSLATIGAGIYAVTKYTYGFMNAQADLDIANQNLARQYMVSANAMLAYNNALKELNLSYEDLFYATDETRQRFNDLVKLGRETEAPEGLEDTLRLVRDISFQFQRLHIIIQSGRRWIAYYVGQLAGSEIQQARETITEFVNNLKDNMPRIAEKVAIVMSWFIKAFSKVFGIAKYGWKYIEKFLDLLEAIFTLIKRIVQYLDFSGLTKEAKSFQESFSSIIDEITYLLSKLGVDVDEQHPLVKFFQFCLDLATGFLDTLNLIIQALDTLVTLVTGDFEGASKKFEGLLNTSMDESGVNAVSTATQITSNPIGWISGKIGELFAGGFVRDALPSSTTTGSYNQTQNNNINQTFNVNSAEEAKSLQEQNIKELIRNTPFYRSVVN